MSLEDVPVEQNAVQMGDCCGDGGVVVVVAFQFRQRQLIWQFWNTSGRRVLLLLLLLCQLPTGLKECRIIEFGKERLDQIRIDGRFLQNDFRRFNVEWITLCGSGQK